MGIPKVAQPAPDFTVTLADSTRLQLGDFAHRPLLLIFLRHLA